jgi:hypothetical protein
LDAKSGCLDLAALCQERKQGLDAERSEELYGMTCLVDLLVSAHLAE